MRGLRLLYNEYCFSEVAEIFYAIMVSAVEFLGHPTAFTPVASCRMFHSVVKVLPSGF